MIKYWIKNRFIFDAVIAIAMALLFCFAFVYLSNNTYNKVKEENSIYVNSEIDYQVPNPSIEQLSEIKNQAFVDDVFGYYLTKTSVTGNNSAKVNIIMSDTMSSLPFTMYNEKNKIESVEKNKITKYAFIDKIAADSLKVSAGDNITFFIAGNPLTFCVSTIYCANPLFKEGSIVLEFTGEIRDIYNANVSSNGYSAAFIKAFSISECSNYLIDYKPLGRLKERSEFETAEAYNTYNNAILSGNYSNEITNFRDNRINANREIDSVKNHLIVMTYAGVAIVSIALIVFALILRNRKSEKNYFKNVLKNKKSTALYRTCSAIFGLVLFVGSTFILQLLIGNISNVVIPIVVILGIYILIYIFDLIQDRSYIK